MSMKCDSDEDENEQDGLELEDGEKVDYDEIIENDPVRLKEVMQEILF